MPSPRTNGSRPALRPALLAVLTLLALAAAPAQETHSLLNRPAPALAGTSLQHQPVDLAALRGKVVLLNFWATWCAPCRLEMPRFIAWQQQLGPRGFQVLGVSIDDDATPVRPFIHKMGVNYPILMGDARLGERYGGVLGVPVTFLIDRRGIVRARIDGGANLPSLERQIRQLLAAP